jgi:hypothetical protein
VSWTSDEPSGTSIVVTVASGNNAGGPFSGPETVTNGVDLWSTPPGQFLEVTFSRANGLDSSPVLFDLTLLHNRPPDCSSAFPSLDSPWPPNHKFVDIDVDGVTHPDGDPLSINIDSIYQDEPTIPMATGSSLLTEWVSAPAPHPSAPSVPEPIRSRATGACTTSPSPPVTALVGPATVLFR